LRGVEERLLRTEFLLKTDNGYPKFVRDKGLAHQKNRKKGEALKIKSVRINEREKFQGKTDIHESKDT